MNRIVHYVIETDDDEEYDDIDELIKKGTININQVSIIQDDKNELVEYNNKRIKTIKIKDIAHLLNDIKQIY